MVSTMNTFAEEFPELALPCVGESFPDPQVLVLNEPLAKDLGLDPEWLRSPAGIDFLTGQGKCFALGYAGHQFGQFNPRMGDGRALLLREDGRDIHAKGTGRTPFSRGGDGHYPLDAALKEYAFAESLHALGVPTARSLAVLTTGGTVIRQQGAVPGGIEVRVATSHLRVGTVQYAATQSEDLVRSVMGAAGFDDARQMLDTVTRRQFDLVAHWMRLGFVHGVMNTDNVALSGETIDYGPCAFTERFDANASFSSIDRMGRYAFGNQPTIIAWNMARLAEAVFPLLGQEKVNEYVATIQPAWDEAWARWIGDDHDGLNQAADITTYNREHGINGKPGPIFIPRNQMLQEAIDAAEQRGEYEQYNNLLAAVSDPYNETAGPEWMARPEGQLPYVTFCGT